jgi:hypothetical protein
MEKILRASIQKHFNIMVDCLQKEDEELSLMSKRLKYQAKYFFGRGIHSLEEKHVQYLFYKSLLKLGDFQVYIEDDYPKKGKKKCDLTLYDLKSKMSLWIEIKVAGHWENIRNKTLYWRWINSDVIKLKGLNKEGAVKFLLITWIESSLPKKSTWRGQIQHNLEGVRFVPSLFDYFPTIFSDGKEFLTGYYAICLLEIL